MSLAFLVAAGVALGAAAMVARFMPGRHDSRGIQGAGIGAAAARRAGGGGGHGHAHRGHPRAPDVARPAYTAASEKLALLRR